ncbi:aminoacyl-tRNA deacylase [Dictyobacter aurantiacus]|uniref:Deacylase n=1 Tax=Dictyobacter aurantiacus TaxID=1936993 RepID=A0A401ZI47_9CHLR|nr:YbaK/EbsC family protein [Dictyobacter aurantiacus]GCE06519.1 deacylase [Dictyobacter aurantiacus]
MQCKEKMETYLHQNQVPFQEQHHPRTFSALTIAESEHISSKKTAKTVILQVNDRMMCFVLPAAYYVDMNKVQAIMGTKNVRLAHEDEFELAFPDCEVGTMPPFGNLYGIPVYVDSSLAAEDSITFPVGTYTDTMSIKYSDFERLVHPCIAMFAHAQVDF